MDKRIRRIMAKGKEPGYDLDDFYRNLKESDKVEFWETLNAIAVAGNSNERLLALMMISWHMPPCTEDLLQFYIRTVSFESDRLLLSSLVTIVRKLDKERYLDFCERVYQYSQKAGDEQNHLSSFRCFLVLRWEHVVDHIREIINSDDTAGIVDTLAYFKYLHGRKEWKRLRSMLSDQERDRVSAFEDDIDNRVQYHYKPVLDS